MSQDSFNRSFIEFLNNSPTPFHAVEQMSKLLVQAGYQSLEESSNWSIDPGTGYFVTRNQSSIIAFTTGSDPIEAGGIRMIGAHTDSPCLKVKPNPIVQFKGYIQLGVEVYGGALTHPWFDRDLSLAGRVNYVDSEDQLCSTLIDFKRPIASIPSLAIHLQRDVNTKSAINPQKHLLPITLQSKDKSDFDQLLLGQINSNVDSVKKILSFELSFYDSQKASLVGLNDEFLAGARLDNLLSCFTGLSALLDSKENNRSCLLVCTDHEEVGSASAVGAQGPFLESVLQRVIPDSSLYHRTMAASMLFSTDNAHGIHPNYGDKHDANHGPILNEGPVIKVNANQRYASNSDTIALFNHLCEQSGIPFQTFVTRADMACGSTIGPLTAAEIGVRTLDIGAPTLAMHSIREIAGSKDPLYLKRVLDAYLDCSNLKTLS